MSKVEVFYTGGGITIAELGISKDQYAVISTEAPEYLCVYNYNNGEKTHLPEDMVASTQQDKLNPELKEIYQEMLNKLNSH